MIPSLLLSYYYGTVLYGGVLRFRKDFVNGKVFAGGVSAVPVSYCACM